MAGCLCLDASFALHCLIEGDEKALSLWGKWALASVDICAPPIFFAEMTSVLRRYVHGGRLSFEQGQMAFDRARAMGVRQVDPAGLQERAWELASRFDRPTAYDCQYLAVARHLDCELWTHDQRLASAVSEPWVRCLA